jgi:prepilin-type N-terminal cleavage/methylation domain-containing protein
MTRSHYIPFPLASRSGFTLIELLIVVAILSITAASSMMLITAPAVEAARATMAQVRLAGESALFQSLTRDAHQAFSVRTSDNPVGAVEFLSVPPSAAPRPDQIIARYSVTPEGLIRRETPSSQHSRSFDLGRPARLQLIRSSALDATLGLEIQTPPELAAGIPRTVQPTSSLDDGVTVTLALLPAILSLTHSTAAGNQP